MNKKGVAILFSLIAIILLCVTGIKLAKKNSENNSYNEWTSNNIGEAETQEDVIIFNEKESNDFYKDIHSVNVSENGSIIVKFNKDLPKKVQTLKEDTKVIINANNNYDAFNNGYAGNISEIDSDNKEIVFEEVAIDEIFSSIDINTENGDGRIEVLSIAVGDEIIDAQTGKARLISGSSSVGDYTLSYENDEVTLSKGDNFEVSYSKDKTTSGKEYFKKLYFDVSSEMTDSLSDKENPAKISLGGSITLEDLFTDINFSLKHNVIPSIEFKLATDITKETTITADINKELEKEIRLGYILLGVGGVTVGNGNYNQPVSIGLAITMDLNGNINVSAELSLKSELYGEVVVSNLDKEDNHSIVKGKSYPHLYLTEIAGDTEDENPSTSLNILGKASGEMKEAALGVKSMVSFMNFDLIATKLNAGVSGIAQGELEYNIFGDSKQDNSNNEQDNPLNLEYSLNIDAIANLKAYSSLKLLNSNNNLLTLNAELFRKNLISIESKIPKVEFDRNIIDYLSLNIIDEKSADINNDGIDDRIVLYAIDDSVPFRTSPYTAIVIFDGDTKEALTSFELFAGYKIGEIIDVTGDDVKDIIVNCHNGAQRGNFSSPFVYKDGKYIKLEESNSYDYKVTLQKDFNIKASIPALNLESTTRLSDEMIEYYKEFNIYNESGSILVPNYNLDMIGNIQGTYIDLDNDNIGEYISFTMYYHNTTAYGYIPVIVETIYKYNNSGTFDVTNIAALNNFVYAEKLGY